MVISLGFVTCCRDRFIAVMSHVDWFNCSPSFPLSPTLLHALYAGHWQWLTFSISGQTVTELKSLRNDGTVGRTYETACAGTGQEGMLRAPVLRLFYLSPPALCRLGGLTCMACSNGLL